MFKRIIFVVCVVLSIIKTKTIKFHYTIFKPEFNVQCPNMEYIDIEMELTKNNEVYNKPWSKSNKYLIKIRDQTFFLKTETSNFEIVYSLIAHMLHLRHSKYTCKHFTKVYGNTAALNKFYEHVKHGWHIYKYCTNVSNIAAFHVLFNDFLMGYSDRAPNCHMINGTVVPIDQDSGSYTAELPPQQDKIYEKHILHNMMLKNDKSTRTAFNNFFPCENYLYYYHVLEYCLKYALDLFPLHSTKYAHILYRFNESRSFACNIRG